jgi:hypothetical protein
VAVTRRTRWQTITLLLAAFLLTSCETIPYNKKAAEVVANYGDTADRHVVSVVTAWQKCKKNNVAEKDCTDAAFNAHEARFYDDWESKLFTAQQQAAAGDVLGICEKAGELAQKYSKTLADKALKTKIESIKFGEGKSCSIGSVGGVLQQHRNLRAFHENFVVIDVDDGKVWRDTIAQSVRIALTVENFKKSASETPGN